MATSSSYNITPLANPILFTPLYMCPCPCPLLGLLHHTNVVTCTMRDKKGKCWFLHECQGFDDAGLERCRLAFTRYPRRKFPFIYYPSFS